MSTRNLVGAILLLAGALGSWYLASSLAPSSEITETSGVRQQGFYLRDARILGTGETGALLYEIVADYAEQQSNEQIAFERVNIKYTSGSEVPWTLTADKALITGDLQKLTLSGNVRAVSDEGFGGNATEIYTDRLELEPENYLAHTDSRVNIRIGERSISATGMEASLRENTLQLKSNVSGKFVP